MIHKHLHFCLIRTEHSEHLIRLRLYIYTCMKSLLICYIFFINIWPRKHRGLPKAPQHINYRWQNGCIILILPSLLLVCYNIRATMHQQEQSCSTGSWVATTNYSLRLTYTLIFTDDMRTQNRFIT